ncbi:MAG: hypothetical protein HS117_25265 [Verrucomicrobiaceae bacterium]|nr:hypothetical protein [Verrucomicrobiaceae bacterium]
MPPAKFLTALLRRLTLLLLAVGCCVQAQVTPGSGIPLPFNLDQVPGAAKPVPPETKPAAPPPAKPDATPPPLPTAAANVLTGPVAQLYLYVEPYQTRVEALFDMDTVESWLRPDDKARPDPITVAAQREVIQLTEKLAADWCAMTTNGRREPYAAPAAFFVKGRPGSTIPMDAEEDIPRNQCMLGLVWQFTTTETPDEVEVMWKGWINQMRSLPVLILHGSQSERGEVNNVIKRITWANKGRLRPAPLAAVPTYEPAQPMRIPVGAIAWILGGIVFYAWIWHRDYRLPGGGLPYFVVWVFGLVLIGKLIVVTVERGESAPRVRDASAAQKIVSPLLRNVYRAFDHRSESRIYDVLQRSIDGELLRKLYLETIQALTLDGREGTRVLITEFEATVDKITGETPSGGFIADCNWSTIGTVGHWGHSHPRYNGYKARVTVEPMEGEWKLTALEVQEVRRK